MTINRNNIEQAGITAIVTLIVAAVGAVVFDINTALYSGISAGLSVTVGKEYGDSVIIENSWHWKDIFPGFIGVIAGLIIGVILYWIM